GLRGGSNEAGVAAAGAGDADQVAAVVGEGARRVVGVRSGARKVLGNDRVLDGKGRARRPSPEDTAAAIRRHCGGGDVRVDGIVQECQAAGEGGRRIDASAASTRVIESAVTCDGVVGDGRAAGSGAGRLDFQTAATGDGGIADEGATHDGKRRPIGEKPAAAAAAGVVFDYGIADRGAGSAFLDGAAVADGRVVDEDAIGDDQGAHIVLVGEAAAHAAGKVVGDGAVNDGHGAIAGVADAAAAGGNPRGEGLVVADD